jgi:hypothetical protein
MGDLTYHIRHFLPDVDDESLVDREALLVARDYAALRKAEAVSEFGYTCACEAHAAAGAIVFARVSVARLQTARSYCRHLVMASYLADQFHLDGGG